MEIRSAADQPNCARTAPKKKGLQKSLAVPTEPRTGSCSMLEPEHNSCVIAEIALVIIAATETVPKPSEHKIELGRPDSDRFC